MELRLSDGLYKLAENEADTITICGMGGKLIQSILENGSSKISENTQLILSPQSEIREFRKYLSESGYETVKEYMISEDGQFYVIIDCRRNGYKNELICTGETEKEVYYRYGEELLKEKNKSLREYLLRELRISQGVRNKLENINNDKIAGRLKEHSCKLYTPLMKMWPTNMAKTAMIMNAILSPIRIWQKQYQKL